MKSDSSGFVLLEEQDVIELMYQDRAHGELFTYDDSFVDQVARSAAHLSLDMPFRLMLQQDRSVDDMTNSWRIPAEYQQLDVDSWFAQRIHTIEQAERVADELALYKAGDLYPLLRFLIYVVDLMREHKIVWGVGRGSSVASYCLFIIGIHKIDSMKYRLDIKEFLK